MPPPAPNKPFTAPAAAPVPVQEAVPVEVVTAPADAVSASPGVKMTKVDILCKMERFDALKRAMFDIGITVADVQGKTYWAAYIMRTPENPTNDE